MVNSLVVPGLETFTLESFPAVKAAVEKLAAFESEIERTKARLDGERSDLGLLETEREEIEVRVLIEDAKPELAAKAAKKAAAVREEIDALERRQKALEKAIALQAAKLADEKTTALGTLHAKCREELSSLHAAAVSAALAYAKQYDAAQGILKAFLKVAAAIPGQAAPGRLSALTPPAMTFACKDRPTTLTASTIELLREGLEAARVGADPRVKDAALKLAPLAEQRGELRGRSIALARDLDAAAQNIQWTKENAALGGSKDPAVLEKAQAQHEEIRQKIEVNDGLMADLEARIEAAERELEALREEVRTSKPSK